MWWRLQSVCKISVSEVWMGTVSLYECEECGLVLNRDLNAAINIRNEGLRQFFKN